MKRFLSLILILVIPAAVFCQHYFLFTGTYTNGNSKGIYVYDLNLNKGTARELSVASSKNPSYLAITKDGKYLYAVNENGSDKPGEVSSFSINRQNGKLEFINSRETGGADPCYISVTRNRKWIVVANYNGGNLSALSLNGNGSIGDTRQVINHYGKSINKDRQEKAHVHMALFSAGENYVYTPDLGMDKVMIYQFNSGQSNPLQPARDSVIAVQPGHGPRHLAFHPRLPYAYLVEELSGTIAVFKTGPGGSLQPLQDISSHPVKYSGVHGSADIHVSPDGKFLYASNRGDANTIAIFPIGSDGKLGNPSFQPVMGETPRNFIIDPSGNFLLVANQTSSNIVVFRINRANGLLRPTGLQVKVPNPVCLKLLPR